MAEKRYKGFLGFMFILLLSAGICAVFFIRNKDSISVQPAQERMAVEPVYFYQQDDAWKNDRMGNTEFTLGDSGCLVSCIAAIVQMQEITAEGVEQPVTPQTLNRFFTEQGVYDSEANLQWDMLEQVLPVSVVRKDASALAEGELERILSDGCYPIVRVRMHGIGSYHYVLITGSEEGEFLCMDPMEKETVSVPLSSFGGRIYAVRYLVPEEDKPANG